MRDWLPLERQRDSSPLPSPRTRRRGIADSIAHASSTRRLIFRLLCLSQRERIKVRDCCEYHLQVPTKSLRGHCRVLPSLDGSRSGRWQFLVSLEIPFASDLASRAGGNHDPSHPIRSQALGRGNRNPRRRDQSGAVAEICSLRSVDFGDVAREYARNRSLSFGGNEDASLIDSLITALSCGKRNYGPLTSVLSPRAGRGGIRKTLTIKPATRPISPLPFLKGED